MNLDNIIIKPMITEKSSFLKDYNMFGFHVNLKANKYQIKSVVEKLYDVKVLKVRTSIAPGKLKRAGRNISKKSSIKKAYVQLEKGQKIEFFKGV